MFAKPVFINPGRYIFKLIEVVIPRGERSAERSAERSEFIISAREARAVCTWILASCKLAAFIFTCISDGVRHDVIQSFDVTAHFLFLGNIRLKAIFPSMTKLTCLFIVCEIMFTTGESQAISYANETEQQ